MSEDHDERNEGRLYPTDRCERVQLLLSLAADDGATADQTEEIADHLPGCAACRAAQSVDRAVRTRLAEPAEVPAGFAGRVLARLRRARLETRAQNRFLIASAAAALLVAAVTFTGWGSSKGAPDTPAAESLRQRTGRALVASVAVEHAGPPAEER